MRNSMYMMALALAGCLYSGAAVRASENASAGWQLNMWEPPFDYRKTPSVIRYEPLNRASRNWRLCVSYPHLKDPYWLSVNYGMAREAERLGVSFRLAEAGGYPNLANQARQIGNCVAEGADALILGTVSFAGLTGQVMKIAGKIPVIATVNDIDNRGISAKVGVSWVEMGRQTGAYLARKHPKGSKPVRIALFPGPEGPEWVDFELQGFREAIKNSAVTIAAVRRGDTGKEIQRNLVEEVLETVTGIDYIVGTAPTAEAAISILQRINGPKKPQVISFYFTHGVFRGIKRGRILAAPTDQPVLQGKISIEMAVRVLENKVQHRHLGPDIVTISAENHQAIDPLLSLAPASFAPVFQYKASVADRKQ